MEKNKIGFLYERKKPYYYYFVQIIEKKGNTFNWENSLAIAYHVAGSKGSKPLLLANRSQSFLILVLFFSVQYSVGLVL